MENRNINIHIPPKKTIASHPTSKEKKMGPGLLHSGGKANGSEIKVHYYFTVFPAQGVKSRIYSAGLGSISFSYWKMAERWEGESRRMDGKDWGILCLNYIEH